MKRNHSPNSPWLPWLQALNLGSGQPHFITLCPGFHMLQWPWAIPESLQILSPDRLLPKEQLSLPSCTLVFQFAHFSELWSLSQMTTLCTGQFSKQSESTSLPHSLWWLQGHTGPPGLHLFRLPWAIPCLTPTPGWILPTALGPRYCLLNTACLWVLLSIPTPTPYLFY